MDASLVDPQTQTGSSADYTALSSQMLYQHDPLFVLLKDKLHLNNLWIVTGAIVLPGGVFLIWWLTWADKVRLWTPDNTLVILLQTFIIFPLLIFIYLLIPSSISDLFNTLKANGVIGEHRDYQPGTETYGLFVQKLIVWMNTRWWTATAFVISFSYAFFRLLVLEPKSPSPVPYGLRVSAIIMYLPAIYATFMSVVRLLLALIFTNWLFNLFTIQVKPLHPDGSGGLGSLGRILWLSVVIMLWDALLFSAAFISSNLRWFSLPEMALLGAIYLALTPSLLIGWLVLPHRMMLKAREKALQPLADEFRQALMQSMSSTEHNTHKIIAVTNHLVALKQRYDLVRDTFPTWPLEINKVSRVVITAILPALLPLILPLTASLISFVGHALGFP